MNLEKFLVPANLAVREKDRLVAFFVLPKTISKMGIDKKISQIPTRGPFSTQQKRHFIRSALSNGGAVVRDEITSPVRVRRNSLFIRQLAGNYRYKFVSFWILEYMQRKIPRHRYIEGILKIP